MARIWIDEPNDYLLGLRVSATEVTGSYDPQRDGYEVDEATAQRWLATQAAWDAVQAELGQLQIQHRTQVQSQRRRNRNLEK